MPLREVIESAYASSTPVIVPGAADALTARVIEDLGFPAVYVTGAGLANAHFGYPDMGLIGLAEVVDHVGAIGETIGIPLVVDADTGFGNPINVQRTVRLLERAGASAIQIEDQVAPKRCGHFDGKEVISAAEMVQKIHAAVDARRSDTLIIARTDAAAVLGMGAALDRAAQYRDAGADLLFVEAPVSAIELASIPATVRGIHLANMVEGGKTPLLSANELSEMGFTVILYANSALRAAIQAVRSVLGHLLAEGSTQDVLDQLIVWDDRQTLVRKPHFDELDLKYRTRE